METKSIVIVKHHLRPSPSPVRSISLSSPTNKQTG